MSARTNLNQPEPLLTTSQPASFEEVEQIITENVAYKEPVMLTVLPTNSEEIQKIIADTAYYKAEKRGFEPGYEEQDWIESETEILGRYVDFGIENTEIQ